MARNETQGAVRPLTVQQVRAPSARRLPIAVAVALLTLGASAGYLVGSPASTDGVTASTTTASPVAAAAVPTNLTTPSHYTWLEQNPLADEQEAWAVYAAAELHDYLYLLVADSSQSRRDKVLWRSQDGESWERLTLDLGLEALITDLDVLQSSLLLSGWNGVTATSWRSQTIMAGEDPSWVATALPSVSHGFGDIDVGSSVVTSVVNESGEVLVSAIMEIDLTSTLIGLPTSGAVDNLLSFGKLPEVATTGSRLWMRVETKDGIEQVHTQKIPTNLWIDPVAGDYGTDIPSLTAKAFWTSQDATAFHNVQMSAFAGNPSPLAFRDTFVAVITDPAGRQELWISANGSAWSPSSWTVPAECGDWGGVAIGGPGLLVTNDAFDVICLTGNGTEWEVRPSLSTAVSSTASVRIEGDAGGYMALARNAAEYAILTSNDGFGWDRVESRPEIRGIRTFLVGDRLVTSARPMGTARPRPLRVWVGEGSER